MVRKTPNHLILIEPKVAANVGSIARSMKCFGFSNLIIVNKPKCISLETAKSISKQGKDIIESVTLIENLDNIPGIKIGSISIQDNIRYNFQLCDLEDFECSEGFYLVLGRESSGLTFEEMKICAKHINISSEGKYGILNLSQAATIIMYRLYRKSSSGK